MESVLNRFRLDGRTAILTGVGPGVGEHVAKAYAELESQGVIETIPGKGCFLKENDSPFTRPVRQKLLQAEIDEAVVMAHHLQVDREKFLALVKERLDYFERKSAKGGD